MIFATAGHVDHGKTTLIQAITGVNTAHLPEEKKRGMTIDLGYAYWPQSDGSSIGFVDVPGHEKFLANMLAGVGGIDHVLLVVACDDGVMAQTREHLVILRLIGCPVVIVALTKADRVEPQRIIDVRQQIEYELVTQGWIGSPLFVTAATEEESVVPLRQHLLQLHQQNKQHEKLHQRFRLAIDRAFSVKGAGLVVTGTALAGQVSAGDILWLTGSDKQIRVRGLHAQNQQTSMAQAGQRIALNIIGDVSKEQVSRGDWLLSQKPFENVERVLVEVETDEPLRNWQSLHIHHAASHITGRISLLNQLSDTPRLAELVLDSPLWLVEHDRLILRDISARKTLAGARVINLNSPRRGKRQPEFLHWLTQLAKTSDHAANLTLHLLRGALSLSHFSWARQLTEADLHQLLADMDVIIADGMVLSQSNAGLAEQKLLQVLAEYHQQHADQLGLGRARLKRMALPALNEALVYTLIDLLLRDGQLKQSHGWLYLPEQGLAFSDEQAKLWQRVAPYFTDDPWWVRDLASDLKEEEAIIRSLLKKSAQLGHITAIVPDRYYGSQRIQQFAELIRKFNQNHGAITAADFRDELGIGRKLAIQILEFFDHSGFTRRQAESHILRDNGLF
ncbi:selenocysteine-specific translation elongation factor [Photorhabdus temperata]|uniref:Selenocysteine-specific elongation factor n=1 Tax=Photorhabdus temperata subsp. temperata Meg1 TaxID=1393735 RepID=A0A081RXA0_PHOTE|nr:selenocysteine-specific translation elongation factor [Photorhabdus temperata]KER03303.1 selenocysteine-specific translation elongation factor SelB [Photorhabdus temperata subsp. temperata Meg1]MCT8346796.1 selenocysteine-specific translation elongation factor [Photorhabdus temperata]